jgi:Spy/CpxP family protein refolding chaperone
MRTHRTLMVTALVLAVLTALAGVSSAQCGGHGQRDGRMGPGGAALQPAFTTEQQEQIEKIRTKYQDQRVELYNKIGVIRLEMRDLLSQPEPDFTKVETKIDAISELHAKLAKMRLQQHKEIRGILTAEQRTLFDRGFADGCCDGHGGGQMGCGKMGDGGQMGCGKMGAGGQMGCKMGGGGQMGCGGMMGAGGAAGCGGAMGCAAMGAGAGAGAASCPMVGGAGPMRGMKPQAREWRRWL